MVHLICPPQTGRFANHTTQGMEMTPEKMTKTKISDLIDAFLDGTCGEWEWDDFISVRLQDHELEDVRQRCAAVANTHPPTKPRTSCSEEGIGVLRSIAKYLRGNRR